jgi:hypothetical protein
VELDFASQVGSGSHFFVAAELLGLVHDEAVELVGFLFQFGGLFGPEEVEVVESVLEVGSFGVLFPLPVFPLPVFPLPVFPLPVFPLPVGGEGVFLVLAALEHQVEELQVVLHYPLLVRSYQQAPLAAPGLQRLAHVVVRRRAGLHRGLGLQ